MGACFEAILIHWPDLWLPVQIIQGRAGVITLMNDECFLLNDYVVNNNDNGLNNAGLQTERMCV